MKIKKPLKETLLMAAGLLMVGVNTVNAACEVSTDSYGKTKIVWDFGVIAETNKTVQSYYLNASTNAYGESSMYKTSGPISAVAMVVIQANSNNRGIYANSTPDNDKGAGAVIGNNEGYLEFYAPVSGTLTLTGKYLTNVTITDKSNNDTKLSYSTSGTNNTNLTTSEASVIAGHKIQITVKGGTGIGTMTLTPSGYDSDVVLEGTMDFTSTDFLAGCVVPKGTYVVTSKGYKSVANKEDIQDALVIYTKGDAGATNDGTIDISSESYRGIKIAGNSKNEYNYTTSKHGYLTITYNYGGDRGTWYIKNTGFGNIASKGDKTSVVYLAAGQRLQVVTGSNGIFIKSLSFTEVSSVPVTIGITGYTTFASSYPLNIDGMTASEGEVKAYYVTASDVKSSSVALTEVTGNVAAGTGLILEGTAGATITIPVVASGTDYSSTNKLVGCTSDFDITTSTPNYSNFYVLSATTAAFKKIQSWVEASNTLTIPAGKAYLDTTGADVVGAPSLTFDFGGTTGIGATLVNNEKVNSDIYNLAGQRVAQPTKGLFIQNGRKVIIK